MTDAAKASLATAIEGYAAQLASDSASPQPSYTLNGKSVSRNEWRDGLNKIIKELQALINQDSPGWVATRAVPPPY